MAKNTFYYHNMDKVPLATDNMSLVRTRYMELYDFLQEKLPECESKDLCITHLEDSLMRGIQSIAVTFGEKIEKGG